LTFNCCSVVEWQGFWAAVLIQARGAFTAAFVALAAWAAFATALATFTTLTTFCTITTFAARLALFVAAFGAFAALFTGHAFVACFGACFGLGFR
jgi:hypothetical protein